MADSRPTPSEVACRLGPLLALPNAFGRAEDEQAAAIIICALSDMQSDWAPVRTSHVVEFLKEKVDSDRFRVLRNPFFRPDVHSLAARGFATFVPGPDGHVELTDDAIARCCKAVGFDVEAPRGS